MLSNSAEVCLACKYKYGHIHIMILSLKDGVKYKKPVHLPAPQYIALLMDWVSIFSWLKFVQMRWHLLEIAFVTTELAS